MDVVVIKNNDLVKQKKEYAYDDYITIDYDTGDIVNMPVSYKFTKYIIDTCRHSKKKLMVPILTFEEIEPKECCYETVSQQSLPFAELSSFKEILPLLQREFPAQADLLYSYLCQSKSLTLVDLTTGFCITRQEARNLVHACVRIGAYFKYYTSWHQTEQFKEWVKK